MPQIVSSKPPDLHGVISKAGEAAKYLQQIKEPLASLESSLVAGTVTAETQSSLGDLGNSSQKALSKLLEMTGEPDETPTGPAQDLREKARRPLQSAQAEISSATTAVTRITVPPNLAAPQSFLDKFLSDWGATVAIAAGALLGVILLIFGAKAFAGSIGNHFDQLLAARVEPALAGIQKQQKVLADQLATLTSSNDGLNTRLSDVHTEVRSVSRLVRDASLDGIARSAVAFPGPHPQMDQPAPEDEPLFPISTVDYLEKMRRHTLVVKPDFQNGILVTDPDGKGELALIGDPKIDEDRQPLFVVPRAAQFQTKQDFHTYYEKYYDCDKPSAGDVWIVEPAVVSKVQGGWLLREKGVLEIR